MSKTKTNTDIVVKFHYITDNYGDRMWREVVDKKPCPTCGHAEDDDDSVDICSFDDFFVIPEEADTVYVHLSRDLSLLETAQDGVCFGAFCREGSCTSLDIFTLQSGNTERVELYSNRWNTMRGPVVIWCEYATEEIESSEDD